MDAIEAMKANLVRLSPAELRAAQSRFGVVWWLYYRMYRTEFWGWLGKLGFSLFAAAHRRGAFGARPFDETLKLIAVNARAAKAEAARLRQG